MSYPPRYFEPRPRNRTCLVIGCIAALAIGVPLVVCCLAPAGLGFFAAKTGSTPAYDWLRSVSAGQLDAAGELTVGGVDRARELARKVEGEVGRLDAPGSFEINTSVSYTNGVGRITLPISGDKGRATAIFQMEKHGDEWQVKDITLGPADMPLTES